MFHLAHLTLQAKDHKVSSCVTKLLALNTVQWDSINSQAKFSKLVYPGLKLDLSLPRVLRSTACYLYFETITIA